MAKAHIGTSKKKKSNYNLSNLTKHAVVLGTTGSGKTVMGKILIEEALAKNIPVIAIDPKGDIGSLAIVDKNYDFRPFSGSKKQSEKIGSEYLTAIKNQEIKVDFTKLSKIKTKIYTPKSNNGIPVSLMPDLSAPKKFKKLSNDPNFVSDFVVPISAGIINLAGVKGASAEKANSLVSSIIIHHWERGQDLTIERLISDVVIPPFTDIGSLSLEDFMKENERKKLASSLNLILSSPAKKAWKHGEKLNIEEMLKPGNLSVFDLRFTSNNEEKQFVSEQIMQELYKYLIKKGGSSKLRFILYIDELAGLLPPPPASPPSKKLLELLIRQGRAFGLGIIVATQNPGDIDYRLFGNIGTRFIGRLRTANDIGKVATAMDIVPSKLKTEVSALGVGQFVFNDAIKNTMQILNARWLITYHRGPLKPKEIELINTGKRPRDGKLTIKAKEEKKSKVKATKKTTVKAKPKLIKLKEIIKKPKLRKKDDGLKNIIKYAKKHSDKTQAKIKISKAEEYIPHLRIVIEPKEIKGLNLTLKGPYFFDLSSRMIPTGNYLKNITWSSFIRDDIIVHKPKYSIERTLKYCIKEAKSELKTDYYESTIINIKSKNGDLVEKENYTHIMKTVDLRINQLDLKTKTRIKDIEEKIKKNSKQASSYNTQITKTKAKRMIKRVIGGKKLTKKPLEIRIKEKRVLKLKKQNESFKKQIKKHEFDNDKKKLDLKNKAYQKSHTCVKKRTFNPLRKELIVHTTVLLVPKRVGFK